MNPKDNPEIDINKLIYNPLLKAVYMSGNEEKYAACEKQKEEYRQCLINMQQSGRRKWQKQCFKLESELLKCINSVKLSKVESEKSEKVAELSKTKIKKPNDIFLKEMEEDFAKQKKLMEEAAKKRKSK